jgi:hypothetical protein
MKNHSFIYNNEEITFLNSYLAINNCSIEDLFLNMTVSDIIICTLCVVQLESAYVFQELCQQAVIIWHSKYADSQIIKCEQADEADNDSQNDFPPALVDNLKNEKVSGENDEYLSNSGSTKETGNDAEICKKPTHSNDEKKAIIIR